MLTNADYDQLAHDTAEAGFDHLEELATHRQTSSVLQALAAYFQVEVVADADDRSLAHSRQCVLNAEADGFVLVWTWNLACGCVFNGPTGEVNPSVICASHRWKD